MCVQWYFPLFPWYSGIMGGADRCHHKECREEGWLEGVCKPFGLSWTVQTPQWHHISFEATWCYVSRILVEFVYFPDTWETYPGTYLIPWLGRDKKWCIMLCTNNILWNIYCAFFMQIVISPTVRRYTVAFSVLSRKLLWPAGLATRPARPVRPATLHSSKFLFNGQAN